MGHLIPPLCFVCRCWGDGIAGMELHLQGSSGGNLWLLDSQPPFQHSRKDNCQTSNPSPFSPRVPLLSYKSPASLPARPDSIQRDPWGWLSSLGPFQISEHDATASGPISLMLSALIFSVTHVRSYSTKARKQTKSTAGSTLEIGSQSNRWSTGGTLCQSCDLFCFCCFFSVLKRSVCLCLWYL